MRQIEARPEDYDKLFAFNPLAAEQLKNIILIRLLEAAEAKLAEQTKEAS